MEKPSIVQEEPNIPQKDLVIPTPKKDLTSAKCRRQEKRGEKKGIEEECIAQKSPRSKSSKSSARDRSTQKAKALNDPKCSSCSGGKGAHPNPGNAHRNRTKRLPTPRENESYFSIDFVIL